MVRREDFLTSLYILALPLNYMILAKYLRYLISTTSQNWFEHEKRIEVAKSLAHSHHLIGVNYNYYSYSVTTLLSTFF